MKSALLVFFGAFAVYLWTMPPTLPAYRDAGEMATSAYTLGVSHPPSYPLYILAGHAIDQVLPFAKPAFRLTLLSVLTSSALLALMFFVLSGRVGVLPALGATFLLGSNITFWSVTIVPEMYTLTLLFAWILLALAFRLQQNYRFNVWLGTAFLFGIFLGNRTELLLWIPGLVLLALSPSEWRMQRNIDILRWAVASLAAGALGLSIYLYLPLRSTQGPWLDWNHPATLYNFIGSLTRRGYGGTLDLLSESYPMGANFLANLWVYTKHLWTDFLGPACILVVAGIYSLFKRNSRECAATAAMYIIAGPFFIFLANMPPNPHALAIVEPHYLLSDLILAFWAAEGFRALRTSKAYGRVSATVAVAVVAMLPWTVGEGLDHMGGRWSQVNRRWTLNDSDWCRNVFRSTPMTAAEIGAKPAGLSDGPVVIAKKDVQLFSLWYYQTVEKMRPDIHLIAQGLSASPWYQEARRRIGEGVWVGPLRNPDEWRHFTEVNGPMVFTTTDSEIPQDLKLGAQRGLVSTVSPSITSAHASSASDGTPYEAIWHFIFRRGAPHYDEQQDFFNSDLVESYAVSHQRVGVFYNDQKQWQAAVRQFNLAWSMKWMFPEITPLLGFAFYNMGQLNEAAIAYRLAVSLFERTIQLTEDYHSLPALKQSIQQSDAEAHLNLGVVLEKMGKHDEAQSNYQDAIRLAPAYGQPHYNLAVSYWNKDWGMVVREMSEYLRLNPTDVSAQHYFEAARQHLAQAGGPRPLR